jgi:hypothetical protein
MRLRTVAEYTIDELVGGQTKLESAVYSNHVRLQASKGGDYGDHKVVQQPEHVKSEICTCSLSQRRQLEAPITDLCTRELEIS